MANATERNRDDDVPLEKKLDDLHALIEGNDTAMLTTRRLDGSLVTRPMALQKRDGVADLWFMTDVETHKTEELEANPDVNVAFYNSKSREWISISGRALLTQDREQIHRLYEPDWKAWLGDEGGERDGGPDDPRIGLILVEAQSVVYSKNNKPKPLLLFEVAKAIATGTPPKVADLRTLEGEELR